MALSLFTTTRQILQKNAVYTGEIWTSPTPDMHLSTSQTPVFQYLYWNRYLVQAPLQAHVDEPNSRQLVLCLPEMPLFLENAQGLQTYIGQWIRGVFSLFWFPAVSGQLQGRVTDLWTVYPVEPTGLAHKQGLDDLLFAAQHSGAMHDYLGVFEIGLSPGPYHT